MMACSLQQDAAPCSPIESLVQPTSPMIGGLSRLSHAASHGEAGRFPPMRAELSRFRRSRSGRTVLPVDTCRLSGLFIGLVMGMASINPAWVRSKTSRSRVLRKTGVWGEGC